MKNLISAATLPLVFTAGRAGPAPAPPPTPPPHPPPPAPTRPPAASGQQPTTTLSGCLYREDQIPGRKPNVAERAGVLEDYILADASMAKSETKPGAPPAAT